MQQETSGNVKKEVPKKTKSAAVDKGVAVENCAVAAVDKDENVWPGGGKKYSNTERLLICKAWVRTSEDPIAGLSMTGADFSHTMHANFVSFSRSNM